MYIYMYIFAYMSTYALYQVIIDHWGFFLQPATGFGERSLDEASWQALLKLSEYPQARGANKGL